MTRQAPVTLFVVPDCPLCTHARRQLNARGIEFVERNVAGDFGALRAMYELTRQRLVPVVECDGRAYVRPDEQTIDRLAETARREGQPPLGPGRP